MTAHQVAPDGTLTIPAAVLRAANLLPGDVVSFELTADGGVALRSPFAGSSRTAASADEAEPMSTDNFLKWLDSMAGVPTE
ncbi:MAG: AbrB/MazE/SpoVT family DNA-binding domain-containing protein [Tepidiformaceae bacterium]